MIEVEQSSVIAAPAEAVWRRATSPEGINDELRPWLRMTMPRGLKGLGIEEASLGEVLGRSWLLLGGVLPVDYDDLCLVELEPGKRFLERSRLGSMREWQHERTIEPLPEAGAPATPGRCRLTDRLSFEPRALLRALPGSQRLGSATVASLYRHRHRRLAAHFEAG